MMAPHARKPSANVTPNVLIEMPKTITSGFTGAPLTAASAPADSTINPDGKATLELRQRHGPAGAHADDDVPAWPRVRGVRRRAVRGRRGGRCDRRGRRAHACAAAVRLRQDRARDARGERGHSTGAAGAARD